MLAAAVALAPVGATAANARPLHGPPRTFELGVGTVGGHRLLGRSVAGVTAALGRPSERRPGRVRYVLRYAVGPAGFVDVVLRRSRGRLAATSVVLQSGRLVEATTGRLLRLRPRQIQARIASAYADELTLRRAYRCRSTGLCSGEFAASGSALRVTFGTVGGARYINVWQA